MSGHVCMCVHKVYILSSTPSFFLPSPSLSFTLPLTNLRIVHESSDDAACSSLPSLAVHHGNMLQVRVQPRLHGLANTVLGGGTGRGEKEMKGNTCTYEEGGE